MESNFGYKFEENNSYDIVIIDIANHNVVSEVLFTMVIDDFEDSFNSMDGQLLTKAQELKDHGKIGNGKTLPVRVATFAAGVPYKFYSFEGFV